MNQVVASQRQCLSAWESVSSILESLLGGRPIGAKMPLAESKCANSLRTLGANKAEFKNWNERLINALAQCLGAQWRPFMTNLNRELDVARRVLTATEVSNIVGYSLVNIVQGDHQDESIYGLLVHKTESEAALRVNSGEPGHGIDAYMRLYIWFSGTLVLHSQR